MAVGNKIYLADKQTLDVTKSNTEAIKTSVAPVNSKLDLIDTKISTKAEQNTVNTINSNVNTGNTNINTINTKVGANSDVAGTTTVFARLKQIYDYLTGTILTAINGRQANWGATTTHSGRIDANISSRQASWGATTTHRDRIDTTISSRASQTTVNTINSNIGSNSDGSSASGSVHAKLKDIKGVLDNFRAVKSVQRGIVSNGVEPKSSVDVTISSININKSIINLPIIYNSSQPTYIYANLVNNNTLRFTNELGYKFGNNLPWEVIEFY